MFYDITGASLPQTAKDIPLHFLIPAFIISELKTAFQTIFLLREGVINLPGRVYGNL